MGFLLKLLLSLAAALVLGVGSVYVVIDRINADRAVQIGPWSFMPVGAGSAPTLYDRAINAHTGFLALNTNDALYFTAATDGAGEPLTGACRYRVEGAEPAAQAWTLTAYDEAGKLIPNEARRYSVANTVGGGRAIVTVAARREDGLWLPVEAGKPFVLVLRLFGPTSDPTRSADPDRLPRIIKTDCP